MIPDHFVGMNSASTPMSWATRLATSISKPTKFPDLSCIAQGTKVDMPTRSTPRFITCSCMLSPAPSGRAVWAAACCEAKRVSPVMSRNPIHRFCLFMDDLLSSGCVMI